MTDTDRAELARELSLTMYQGSDAGKFRIVPDDLCDRILSALAEARAREDAWREALERLATAVESLPVEDMVQDRPHGPELLGYYMQAQGEWDEARGAAQDARTTLASMPAPNPSNPDTTHE
jgi:hypothetical protein